MPPSRIHGRYSIGRRPSAFPSPSSDLIKPGIYGASPSPRSVTFAPNVTPGTYKESDDIDLDNADDLSLLPDAQLFPPSEQPSNPTTKRRVPPGKRRSLGYIPRPPNAFMLFRADFVRQKHVPGSIETNHGSLSKIIGNCWRALPLDEKRIWEIKAKQEKEAHAKRYPGYRFRPVHNKDKAKKREKALPTLEDERRCEEVAQLLLEGIKGDELAAAIRKLDEKNAVPSVALHPQHQSLYPPPPRRSSSVPLPDSRFHHPIAIPSVPFFGATSRSASPVNNISRNARMIIGQRRPSSALPHFGRTSWGVDDMPFFPPSVSGQDFFALHCHTSLQRDELPLPDVNTGLFEANFGFPAGTAEPVATTFGDFFLAPHAASESPVAFDLAPTDHISQDMTMTLDCMTTSQFDLHQSALTANPASWSQPPMELTNSSPSSTYSGSPAQSDLSLPLVAPQPQHAPVGMTFDMWQDVASACQVPDGKATPGQVQSLSVALGAQHLGVPAVAVAGVDVGADQQMHLAGFDDMLFNGAFAVMQGF